MLDSWIWLVSLMGQHGFSAVCIQRELGKKGVPISVSSVYHTLKKQGVSIRAYRRGDTDVAQQTINRLEVPRLRRQRG